MKETHARLHSNDKLKPKMDFFEPHYFFIIHIISVKIKTNLQKNDHFLIY